jgi:uncharacterized protein YegL
MADELKLRLDELTDNPTARVPVCLALDLSGSMSQDNKIQELNGALQAFYRAVREDEMASIAAEIAIVTFGSEVRKAVDFSNIERQQVPALVADGATPMGAAVSVCLDMLDQAKRVYSKMGVDYFQPWLVLMTDGAPTDDISGAALRCRELVAQHKLTVFPVAIGTGADTRVLSQFSPSSPVLRAQATDFRRFFAWLAKSINTVSLSNPGDKGSASFGMDAFEKMSKSWHDAFNR